MDVTVFVFLALLILTQMPDYNRICKGHKDFELLSCTGGKRSLPVLKWTSESEIFADIQYIHMVKSNHLTPHCACAARGKICYCGNLGTNS